MLPATLRTYATPAALTSLAGTAAFAAAGPTASGGPASSHVQCGHDHRGHGAREPPRRLPEQRHHDRRGRDHPGSERPHRQRRQRAGRALPWEPALRRRAVRRWSRRCRRPKRRRPGVVLAASSGGLATTAWSASPRRGTRSSGVIAESARSLVRDSSGTTTPARRGRHRRVQFAPPAHPGQLVPTQQLGMHVEDSSDVLIRGTSSHAPSVRNPDPGRPRSGARQPLRPERRLRHRRPGGRNVVARNRSTQERRRDRNREGRGQPGRPQRRGRRRRTAFASGSAVLPSGASTRWCAEIWSEPAATTAFS